jgi:hypothetical protein
MAGSAFKTNPFNLNELLEDCENGILQLPDFQRSWVWDVLDNQIGSHWSPRGQPKWGPPQKFGQ